jgi:hypothetical protein
MKRVVMTVFLVLGLLTAGSFAWAQYDMRSPTNSYKGMGRSGFALEDRAPKVQQDKANRKAQQQPKQQTGSSQSTKKPAPKRTLP